MKTLLSLLLFLGISATGSAQLNLEHTYPNGSAFRLSRATYGPAYLYTTVNSVERTYHYFDSLHQNIQTTTVSGPDSLPVASYTLFTWDLFDNDPGFEELVFWGTSSFSPAYGFVYDDDGQVLNDEPIFVNSDVSSARAIIFNDGTKHLLVNGLVFDVQSFEMIHEITDYFTLPFGYKAADLDRKYCYLNTNGQFVALNQDFSIFQASDPLVDVTCNPVIDVMEQKVINANNELEWVVTEFCDGDNKINVYSGSSPVFTYQTNGTLNAPTEMLPQFAAGLDAPKLLITDFENDTTRIFNLLTGEEEWKNEHRYAFRNFEPGVAYFVRSSLVENDIFHTVYGMDYLPVASFIKTPGRSAAIFDFSNQTFDDDPSTFELMYRYNYAPFYSEIVRDNGEIIVTFDSVANPMVSRIPGISDKLITRSIGSNAWSKVYSLPLGTVGTFVPNAEFPLALWPNPVIERLFIDPQTFPSTSADVRIFDALGRIVGQQHVATSEVIEVDTQRWPCGMYVVQVVSGGKTTSRTVVKN